MFYLYTKQNELIGKLEYIGNGDSHSDNNQIIILPGSKIVKEVHITKKWRELQHISRLRQKLISNSKVTLDKGDYYEVLERTIVSSPNLAACILLGRITTAAWDEIKDESGNSLRKQYKMK